MNVSEQIFSNRYLKFTEWFFRVEVQEEETRVRVPEKTIRCIWNDQLFRTHRLRTVDGRDLEVIFPGYWNFGNGPDFKSAAIRVDGTTYEGDVEIHVYAADWRAHNHSANPDYDKVVLHVFLWRDEGKGSLRSHSKGSPPPAGENIFEFELKDYLTKGILELNAELDFDSYPVLNPFNYGLCHKPLARLSREKLLNLLNAAGDARIVTKMGRFHDPVIQKGYEQVFYEGIAEALGYPNNKKPFQILADALPLARIQKCLSSRIRKSDRPLHVQAMLFGMAGLVDFKSLQRDALPAGDRTYFEQLRKLWKKYQSRLPAPPLDPADWKFGGIRPANFPYRRIAGLAHLIVRHEANGMFADYLETIQSALSKPGPQGTPLKTRGKLNEFFCVEVDDYWSDHYTAGGKKLRRAQQLIGPARSREITINIVIPIGLIYARASKSVALEAALNALFQSGKGACDNKLIRFMKHYIFGNKDDMINVLSSDKQIQGLMQVYQDFCTQNENNCLRCQFPDVVNRCFA